MGMSVGKGDGAKAEINITPLVDVVLVLLIIFMVITPLVQMGYDLQIPRKVEGLPPPALRLSALPRVENGDARGPGPDHTRQQ